MSYSCTQASEYSLHSFRHAINCDTKPKELSSFIVYVTAFFAPRGGWNETDVFLLSWPAESEINDKANVSVSFCAYILFSFFHGLKMIWSKFANDKKRRESQTKETWCWCLCFGALNQYPCSPGLAWEVAFQKCRNLLFCFAFFFSLPKRLWRFHESRFFGRWETSLVCVQPNTTRSYWDTARRCQSMLAIL